MKGNIIFNILFLGWIITLNSKYNKEELMWEVHLGAPGLEHPTFSPTIKPSFFILYPDTTTFITFTKGIITIKSILYNLNPKSIKL